MKLRKFTFRISTAVDHRGCVHDLCPELNSRNPEGPGTIFSDTFPFDRLFGLKGKRCLSRHFISIIFIGLMGVIKQLFGDFVF